MTKSKISRDFERGFQMRAELTAWINSQFLQHGKDLILHPLHEFMKTMTPAERSKNSRLRNFVSPVTGEEAMGLTYLLCKGRLERRIPFLFIPSDAWDFYVKIPKDYLSMPDRYITYLISLEYRAMIFSKDLRHFSYPISFDELHKRFRGGLVGGKHNRNRYVIIGFKPSEVALYPFDRPNKTLLFSRLSVMETLQGLFL